jgi:hypothetical protein
MLTTFFAAVIRLIEVNMAGRRPRGVSEILESIDFRLSRLEKRFIPIGAALTIRLVGTVDGKTKELKMLPLKLGQECLISVAEILDAGGNPAQVQDGKLVFELADEASKALGELVEEGPMTARFKRSGKVGLANIIAKGDADLGEGVVEIVGKGEIDCLSGQATVINLKLEAVDPIVPAAKK